MYKFGFTFCFTWTPLCTTSRYRQYFKTKTVQGVPKVTFPKRKETRLKKPANTVLQKLLGGQDQIDKIQESERETYRNSSAIFFSVKQLSEHRMCPSFIWEGRVNATTKLRML